MRCSVTPAAFELQGRGAFHPADHAGTGFFAQWRSAGASVPVGPVPSVRTPRCDAQLERGPEVPDEVVAAAADVRTLRSDQGPALTAPDGERSRGPARGRGPAPAPVSAFGTGGRGHGPVLFAARHLGGSRADPDDDRLQNVAGLHHRRARALPVLLVPEPEPEPVQPHTHQPRVETAVGRRNPP